LKPSINNISGRFGNRGTQGQTKVGADNSIGKLSGQSIGEGIRQIRSMLQNLRNILNNFDPKKLFSMVKGSDPETIKKAMEFVTKSLKKSEMAMQNQSQGRPARQSPRPSVSRDTGLLDRLNLNIPREKRGAPPEFRRLFTPKKKSETPQAQTGYAGDKKIRRENGAPAQRTDAMNARIGRITERQAKGFNLSGPESRRGAREEKVQSEPRETPKEQFRPSVYSSESFRIANPSNSVHAPKWDKDAVRKEEKNTRILGDSGDPNMSSADVKRFLGDGAKARSALDAKVAQQSAARLLAKKQSLGDSKVRFQEQMRLDARLDAIANELNTKLNPDHPDYDLLADSHNRREILEKEQEKIQAKLKELEEWSQPTAN